jgi:homospermidine synthase
VDQQRVVVLSADFATYAHVAADYPGVTYIPTTLTASNYLEVLREYTRPGDFLVNLAVGVGSGELVHFCQVGTSLGAPGVVP